MMIKKLVAVFLLFQICQGAIRQQPRVPILRQNVDRLEYLSRNEHSTGFQLKKWHDLFVADDPRIWDHHTSKLSTMCFKVRHMNHQPGSSKVAHVSEVLRCCEKEEDERMECFQRMQEKYMERCCLGDEMDITEHPCCSKQGEHRLTCFRRNPEITMACFDSFRFNSSMYSYRMEHIQTQRQSDVDSSSSESVEMNAEPEPEVEPASSSSSSSSSSSESSESSATIRTTNKFNDWAEEDEMLIREISEMIPLETEPECLQMRSEDFLRHDLPEKMNETAEICEEDDLTPKPHAKPGKCSKCCKIGAYVGEHYVKRRGCPYIQCRHFFAEFYKLHKKCIKHPRICGHFFVSCCVRHHHRKVDLETEQITEMKEIDILAEPVLRQRNIKRRRQHN